MKEAGIPVRREWMQVANLTEESGYRAMQEILGSPRRPTALFVGNDVVAYGAVQAIKDAGLSIPNDISVVGFDDDLLSRYLNPPLTTVSNPAPGLGAEAARLLIAKLKGRAAPCPRTVLPTSLAARGSCPGALRRPMGLPHPLYPPEAWRITEPAFDPSQVRRSETIFSLGNGTIGLRGNFEEGFPGGVPGTSRNGFYEETPITYGEIAYAYARNRQVMLNVADGKPIRLALNGEQFDLSTGTLLSYERYLDLRKGLLARTLTWRSPGGIEIRLETKRVVSLARRFSAAIEWSLAILEGSADIVVESLIDGSVTNKAASDDPRIGAHFHEKPLETTRRDARGTSALLVQSTRNTRLLLACAAEHQIVSDGDVRQLVLSAEADGDRAGLRVSARAGAGGSIRLVKHLGYVTSLDHPADHVARAAEETVAAAKAAGFDLLLREQEEALAAFWRVRRHRDRRRRLPPAGAAFQPVQPPPVGGTGRADEHCRQGPQRREATRGTTSGTPRSTCSPSSPTRSPTSRARSSATAWASWTRRARARAEMSQRGALFPWRTIGGEETSPYYPAGTAQYHIDADVAYAFREVRGRDGRPRAPADGGAEMLFETARLWADLGAYIPQPRRRVLHQRGDRAGRVLRPGEQQPLHEHDGAREPRIRRGRWPRDLDGRGPDGLPRASPRAIGLADAEIEEWRRAAAQDADRRTTADWASTSRTTRSSTGRPGTLPARPPENYPLLLHYHPLVIYRFQVLKQPDVVLAQVLLGHHFTQGGEEAQLRLLQPAHHRRLLALPLHPERGGRRAGVRGPRLSSTSRRTARMDLDDVNGNVEDGVHTAAMAGTWISIVNGFAGMRDRRRQAVVHPAPAHRRGIVSASGSATGAACSTSRSRGPRQRTSSSRGSRSPSPIGERRSRSAPVSRAKRLSCPPCAA